MRRPVPGKRPPYPIREATVEDVGVLVQHRHRMFEDMRPRAAEEHRSGDRIYRTWLGERLEDGRAKFFVATNRRGSIVASGGVWLREVQPRLSDRGGALSIHPVDVHGACLQEEGAGHLHPGEGRRVVSGGGLRA